MSLIRIPALVTLCVVFAAPVQAARVDPLLTDDTAAVVYVNVRQMVDLPPARLFAEPMLDLVLQLAPELRESLDSFGLRPLDDVDTLTVAVEKGGKRSLIVHGKFDAKKIREGVEQVRQKAPDEIKVSEIDGAFVYEQRLDREVVFSTVVDAKTLLFSNDTVRVVAAAQGKTRPPKLSRALTDLLADMDDRESVWAVFTEPRALLEDGMNKLFNPLNLRLPIKPRLLVQLEKPILRVSALTIRVGIGKEINVAGMLRTDDRDVASLLADVLGESRALRLVISTNPLLGRERGGALAEVLGEAKVRADKTDVGFQVRVTEENLRRIMTPGKP